MMSEKSLNLPWLEFFYETFLILKFDQALLSKHTKNLPKELYNKWVYFKTRKTTYRQSVVIQ